jgi:Flp pilus assembly protein TadG
MSEPLLQLDPRGASPLARVIAALHDDRGGAAISFIASFPIFLIIVAVIVQYALIVNAKITIDHATRAAARAAMTCLPDERPERIQTAACMALVPISPIAKTSVSSEADAVFQAMKDVVRKTNDKKERVPDSFPGRYTYAQQATTITYPQENYLRSAGQEIELRLVYRFYLTVPAAKSFISSGDQTVAGVNGRFLDIVSTCKVQVAHGREAMTNNLGWPE